MVQFSVIVPIFGVEKYIKKCIDSILSQTYHDFELILVNDGSRDNCKKICDDYKQKDERIVVIHKENGGLVSARQEGTKIAQGKYIVCVDGDDWISEDCLMKYYEIIKKTNADIIISGALNYYNDENITKRNIPGTEGLYLKQDIENEIFPRLIQDKNAQSFTSSIWAKAYKREVYIKRQMEVDTRIKIGEDSACVIPCIYDANSIYISKNYTYYYRHNLFSMTKEKKAFKWEVPELIYKHIESQVSLNLFDFNEQLERKIVHELFLVAISQFNKKEGYETIKQEIVNNLNREIYSKCINKAKFNGIKGKIALFILKHRLVFIMYLISKMK